MTSSSLLRHQPDHAAVRARPRHRRRRPGRAVGHQRRGLDPAAQPALSADLCEGEPGGRADRHAGADLAHHLAAQLSRSRRHDDGAAPERRCPASATSPSRAASGRRCASRPISRGSPPMGSAWRPAHRHRRPPTSPGPRARSTARTSPTRSPPTIRSPAPTPTATVIIAYRNSAPVLLSDVAQRHRRPGEHQGRRLVQGQAGRHRRRPSPARRQRHRDRRSACSAELPRLQRAMPSRRRADHGHRPHRHHPRLRARRAVHAGPERRAWSCWSCCCSCAPSAPPSSPAWRCRCRWSPPSG